MGKEDVEDGQAVGLAQDLGSEAGGELLLHTRADVGVLCVPGDRPVVLERPVSELERVAVEDADVAHLGAADVLDQLFRCFSCVLTIFHGGGFPISG